MVEEKLSLSCDSSKSEYVAVQHRRMDLVAFRSCMNWHKEVTRATTTLQLKCKE